MNGPLTGMFLEPIAVLDTGVGPHPDLNVVTDHSCISGKPLTVDQNGHGTHVGGVCCQEPDLTIAQCPQKVLGPDLELVRLQVPVESLDAHPIGP